MKTTHRKTFKEIRHETQILAAKTAWHDGEIASDLRHHARGNGHRGAARAFSAMKIRKVLRVYEIAPLNVKVKIHSTCGHKLLSVKFRGKALHLPLHYAPQFGLHVA